jgi:Protein of unknown function (DUF4242)
MKLSRVCAFVALTLSLAARANESAAPQKRFVVELDPKSDVQRAQSGSIRPIEELRTADKLYVVYETESVDALTKNLTAAGLPPRKITEVRDVNSPVRGGGTPAGERPRDGQKTFVIERSIPGAGTFPDAKKEAISRKSNAAVAQMGDSIEWVHSYLTDEGTYCVYRATDEATVRKHGAIAGAPISRVSEAEVVPTR